MITTQYIHLIILTINSFKNKSFFQIKKKINVLRDSEWCKLCLKHRGYNSFCRDYNSFCMESSMSWCMDSNCCMGNMKQELVFRRWWLSLWFLLLVLECKLGSRKHMIWLGIHKSSRDICFRSRDCNICFRSRSCSKGSRGRGSSFLFLSNFNLY